MSRSTRDSVDEARQMVRLAEERWWHRLRFTIRETVVAVAVVATVLAIQVKHDRDVSRRATQARAESNAFWSESYAKQEKFWLQWADIGGRLGENQIAAHDRRVAAYYAAMHARCAYIAAHPDEPAPPELSYPPLPAPPALVPGDADPLAGPESPPP